MKVLFAGTIGHVSCDEFGHTHFKNLKTVSQTVDTIRATSEKDENNNEDCHGGKSIFTYAPYPADDLDFALPKFNLIFEMVFSAENNFKSPYLEPHRKPPKFT